MGHRALVAYERPDELYNLHYSHNGGLDLQLKTALTKRTPFAGEGCPSTQDLDQVLRKRRGTDELDGKQYVETDGSKLPVEPSPRAIQVSREEILTEQLNYADHEAFYVVSTDFDVTAYRTHWFGLQNVADTVAESDRYGNGALRTVRWYDDEPVGDGFARGEFTAAKRVIGDFLDRGHVTPEEAIVYLKTKLAEWTDERAELLVRTPA